MAIHVTYESCNKLVNGENYVMQHNFVLKV